MLVKDFRGNVGGVLTETKLASAPIDFWASFDKRGWGTEAKEKTNRLTVCFFSAQAPLISLAKYLLSPG